MSMALATNCKRYWELNGISGVSFKRIVYKQMYMLLFMNKYIFCYFEHMYLLIIFDMLLFIDKRLCYIYR